MGSSGSTQSLRPDRAIPLFVRFLGEDDPRRCTGRRLLLRGLVRTVRTPERPGPPSITLDPFALLPLSARDRARAELAGILAVDGSWNRIGARSRLYGTEERARSARRLPMLVATNPQHYGRWGQLTTAEALAAAVFLLGHGAEAEEILGAFPGGAAFFEVNRARLERFRAAPSAAAVLAAERSERDGARPRERLTGPGRTSYPRSADARS